MDSIGSTIDRAGFVSRAWYGASIAEFLEARVDSILGQLAANSDFALIPTQRDAWIAEIAFLQSRLGDLAGSVFLEFNIPRMGRRVDAVLIVGPVVFVVEFKVGETAFDRAAIDQVWDYALDLKNFHQGSHGAAIVPILVATEGSPKPNIPQPDSDKVYRPILTNAAGFRPAIGVLLDTIVGTVIDGQKWSCAPYHPTPTIIEAARSLYAQHSVEAIARYDAGAQNLRVTSHRVEELVEEAKNLGQKIICFVTGVPGAGKTLVGLNVATRRRERDTPTHAVFLSGNGPLVAVLSSVLKNPAWIVLRYWKASEGGGGMRGGEDPQKAMFSYVSLEHRVPAKHPLRAVRGLVDAALQQMNVAFEAMYSHTGRPSIPPERLIRALLLQIFYSIRSERLLMEQLDYNLLFRWFVGLGVDDAVWDASTFAKNRDRLVDHDVGKALLSAVVRQARDKGLVSDEHFSVDGTLIQAWASMKSFQPKDGPKPPSSGGGSNAEVDFRGQKRSNDTHESTTDPECRLYKKAEGQESKLAYLGHALMENRNGLAVDGCVTLANGTAERDAAFAMVDTIKTDGPITLGADKGYDAAEFVERLQTARVVPHIAQNTKGRRSAVPDRVARTPGYAASMIVRKRIEEIFGWAKEIGGMTQTKFRGRARVDWRFTMTLAAYNLVRVHKLVPT